MSQVNVVATFEFDTKDEQKALQLMEKMVSETVKEEGCLRFEMIEDKERNTFFFLNEVWQNKEFHNKHMQTQHFREFISGIKDILKSQIVYEGLKLF